ncbi:MAG: aminotransferase class V-fold PLP-dependent enzyme [Oscillospiraceae bacterium]|jgi:arginine/lysine/ornithine decarboxylase|nr:aminotransferase class V-fold PLP-dependent enzyme [Oscillospiraceae bacterium]
MLIDELRKYAQSGFAPLHMPGHKRNVELLGTDFPYALDVTELPGLDNLHDMRGVLKETASLAAQLYGSERAFPLVGGSTVGILAAMAALTRRGDKVIIARNCHKSVYNAVELLGLEPIYVLPEVDAETGLYGSVSVKRLESVLVSSEITALVITSPTYEGVVSDVSAIAELAHAHGAKLIVDAAHGAHLGFSSRFPESATRLGADAVIMSLHKTLPALTQCALLHVRESFADEVSRQLATFETSSPSYVLLASIDSCLHMLKDSGEMLFAEYARRLDTFCNATKPLNAIKITESVSKSAFARDAGKLVISTREANISGVALARRLRDEFKLELEMSGVTHALAITSICDSDVTFEHLSNALLQIDRELEPSASVRELPSFDLPVRVLSIGEALNSTSIAKQITDSVNYISAEYVWCYPPGSPLLVPGELISDGLAAMLRTLNYAGVEVKSTRGGIEDGILWVVS